jgi:hypothetical protein
MNLHRLTISILLVLFLFSGCCVNSNSSLYQFNLRSISTKSSDLCNEYFISISNNTLCLYNLKNKTFKPVFDQPIFASIVIPEKFHVANPDKYFGCTKKDSGFSIWKYSIKKQTIELLYDTQTGSLFSFEVSKDGLFVLINGRVSDSIDHIDANEVEIEPLLISFQDLRIIEIPEIDHKIYFRYKTTFSENPNFITQVFVKKLTSNNSSTSNLFFINRFYLHQSKLLFNFFSNETSSKEEIINKSTIETKCFISDQKDNCILFVENSSIKLLNENNKIIQLYSDITIDNSDKFGFVDGIPYIYPNFTKNRSLVLYKKNEVKVLNFDDFSFENTNSISSSNLNNFELISCFDKYMLWNIDDYIYSYSVKDNIWENIHDTKPDLGSNNLILDISPSFKQSFSNTSSSIIKVVNPSSEYCQFYWLNLSPKHPKHSKHSRITKLLEQKVSTKVILDSCFSSNNDICWFQDLNSGTIKIWSNTRKNFNHIFDTKFQESKTEKTAFPVKISHSPLFSSYVLKQRYSYYYLNSKVFVWHIIPNVTSKGPCIWVD